MTTISTYIIYAGLFATVVTLLAIGFIRKKDHKKYDLYIISGIIVFVLLIGVYFINSDYKTPAKLFSSRRKAIMDNKINK